ncbi:hypothetical protein FisN_32Hh023 [Fistulifera solaris]|uniref:TLC domain-containing protein n=1 Tax=Fistulifera solaris TaxID=1519565 RepID=A0A1Z5K3I5_FISSO|nr:hypothetical protein FisN_32Hh023 [Fistulifera solaris]|eukprot:GAX20641.1 hypothetical protein FisN_32Hh023 [Fistulifera solaris]
MLQDATLAERIGALNDGPIFLETSVLRQMVVPQTIFCASGITALYVVLLYIIDMHASKDVTASARRKISYQATSLCACIILSMLGLYYEYHLEPSLTDVEKIQGHDHVLFLSCFQLGFQLWAIPVGIFAVEESPIMILHHLTVVAVGIMTGFLRNGFRYWIPFFFGIFELSTIPLSIMNFFKEFPSLVDRFPGLYLKVRLAFCGTFLYVRIGMLMPRLYSYMNSHFLLYSQHPHLPYRVFMSACWGSSVVLLLLQLYWAALILKGLGKAYLPSLFRGKPKTLWGSNRDERKKH